MAHYEMQIGAPIHFVVTLLIRVNTAEGSGLASHTSDAEYGQLTAYLSR